LRSRLADYQLLGPAGPDGDAGRSWLAQPPGRLGERGPVVVTELDDVTDAAWPAVAGRLTELAAVASPHLPRLIEAGRSDEEGGKVTWVSRSHGSAQPLVGLPREPRQTLHVLAGVARGAHDLHEAGWAHGDIRPRLVLVDDGDGLLERPTGRQALLAASTIHVRTPLDLDGIDPDAVWGNGPSRASDLWAIGVTAHTMLTGRPVHPALAGDQVVTGVQRVLVERPALDASLPAPVAEVIGACLAPNPVDRPESAAALAERLEQLAAAS
jgi:serine/threonine protein kinase